MLNVLNKSLSQLEATGWLGSGHNFYERLHVRRFGRVEIAYFKGSLATVERMSLLKFGNWKKKKALRLALLVDYVNLIKLVLCSFYYTEDYILGRLVLD